jgi:aminobenzoyl-glutamate utilization protein B
LDHGDRADQFDCPQRRSGGRQVMAASIIDWLTSPELRAAAKKQFEEDTKEIKYFSLLPPGAKPPVDLNHEMMDKYRPAMRKFYLNKKAEFNSVHHAL